MPCCSQQLFASRKGFLMDILETAVEKKSLLVCPNGHLWRSWEMDLSSKGESLILYKAVLKAFQSRFFSLIYNRIQGQIWQWTVTATCSALGYQSVEFLLSMWHLLFSLAFMAVCVDVYKLFWIMCFIESSLNNYKDIYFPGKIVELPQVFAMTFWFFWQIWRSSVSRLKCFSILFIFCSKVSFWKHCFIICEHLHPQCQMMEYVVLPQLLP